LFEAIRTLQYSLVCEKKTALRPSRRGQTFSSGGFWRVGMSNRDVFKSIHPVRQYYQMGNHQIRWASRRRSPVEGPLTSARHRVCNRDVTGPNAASWIENPQYPQGKPLERFDRGAMIAKRRAILGIASSDEKSAAKERSRPTGRPHFSATASFDFGPTYPGNLLRRKQILRDW